MTYQGKNVLVIGLGVSGRSAARFLLDGGATVVGVDQRQDLLRSNTEIAQLRQRGLNTFHECTPISLDPFDLIVVSPGVPQTHPLYQLAKEKGKEIIGEIELACRHINQPFLGVTGTNGKTTVALLVGHVLNCCGQPAYVLGNVGTPLTKVLPKLSREVIVCELSSYQLETMNTPVLDAGAILNITPDHLDRYPSMEAYAKAKLKLKHLLKPGANIYVEHSTFQRFGSYIEGKQTKTYGYFSECDISCDRENVFF